MKTKVYLRAAKAARGVTWHASSKPNYAAIEVASGGYKVVLPTLAFAVEFDIPDSLFNQASEVAAKINLEKKGVTIAGVIATPSLTK